MLKLCFNVSVFPLLQYLHELSISSFILFRCALHCPCSIRNLFIVAINCLGGFFNLKYHSFLAISCCSLPTIDIFLMLSLPNVCATLKTMLLFIAGWIFVKDTDDWTLGIFIFINELNAVSFPAIQEYEGTHINSTISLSSLRDFSKSLVLQI